MDEDGAYNIIWVNKKFAIASGELLKKSGGDYTFKPNDFVLLFILMNA
jgi:hypothetical protein